jgi:xanthine dehydrogenase YagR molybdenum-binding subunit
MDDARAAGAPVVFEKLDVQAGFGASGLVTAGLPLVGNVRGPATDARGDASAGFAAADIIVEGEYRTQAQSHCCMEPHGIVADWRADGLTVYISTQYAAGVREELARAFGLPLNRVRVVVDAMGGGFGSKATLGYYGLAAVALSRKAGAPVRLVLDRQEEQVDSGYRPATWQRLRIGARRDGALSAISLLSYGSAGTALGAGVGNVASRLYTCANYEESHYDVFINAGPGCAMRAPGAVPGAFALEQAIDELAEKLAMDPIALRDRIDASPARREERRLGAERISWSQRHAAGADKGPIKTGLGMAQSLWGANVQVNSACEVRVLRDGSVEVRSSVQDIGTGTGTVLAQVVAEELGLRAEDVRVRIGDTDFPEGPGSGGSRATASITPRRATPPTRFAGACARSPRRSWVWKPTIWRRAAAVSSRVAIPHARWRSATPRRRCAPSSSSHWLRAPTTMRASVPVWATAPPRRTTSAARNSPRSRWMPRPGSCASSAWSPRTIVAGRSTPSRSKARCTAASCRAWVTP